MTGEAGKKKAGVSQKDGASEKLVLLRKGNKSVVMTGIVMLIAIGCAFPFASNVYSSFDNVSSAAAGFEKAEEVVDRQIGKSREIKKVSDKKTEDKGVVEEKILIVPLDAIIVNLSGSSGRRYLKTKINLEARDEDVKKKIEVRVIQIKDRLITILSSKTLEDIEGIEGQENLRREIKDTVDVLLKAEGGIMQVYFSEFVIQ